MEFVIWDSYLDLSKEGVHSFCQKYAANFNKTPAELESLPLLHLASIYMDAKRSSALRAAKETLNHELGAPIVVFSDVVELVQRKTECRLLDSENLKDIFNCRVGCTTKFFTDGSDLRCEDLTMDGMNYYVFRKVEDPRALGLYLQAVKPLSGLPSREEMDRFSSSLVSVVDRLYGRESSRFSEDRKKKEFLEPELQR